MKDLEAKKQTIRKLEAEVTSLNSASLNWKSNNTQQNQELTTTL